MRVTSALVVVAVVLVAARAGAQTQSLAEASAAAKRAQAAGMGWPLPVGQYLPSVVVLPPPVSPEDARDPQRAAAIAALRAVHSVVAGGGTVADIRSYYLAAKVQIDALPPAAVNGPIRGVGRLYEDAIGLFGAAAARQLSSERAHYYRATYGNDPLFPFERAFRRIPFDGFQPTGAALPRQLAEASAVDSAVLLLALANSRTVALQ